MEKIVQSEVGNKECEGMIWQPSGDCLDLTEITAVEKPCLLSIGKFIL